MSASFVRRLLWEGRLLVEAAPSWEPDAADVSLLEQAFAIQAMNLAGPPLAADVGVLVAAARVVHRTAWYALHLGATLPGQSPLTMPCLPRTADQHFSADVLYRFLPAVYSRLRSQAPQDELVEHVRDLLRDWPLSGVLADIAEPPRIAIDFAGHVGLSFLYGERLAQKERPGWFPTGQAAQYLEIVWATLGKSVPPQDTSVPAQE